MRNKLIISIIISIAILMSINGVSAITETYHPTSGIDRAITNFYTLDQTDLTKLISPDNSYYEKKETWGGNIYSDNYYILWNDFGIDLENCTVINSAKLYIQWNRIECNNVREVRVQVKEIEDDNWITVYTKHFDSTDYYSYSDFLNITDLYANGYDTPTELNNLEVRFQAYSNGLGRTLHNRVEIVVDYDECGCVDDSDCDDGLYCNGQETCEFTGDGETTTITRDQPIVKFEDKRAPRIGSCWVRHNNDWVEFIFNNISKEDVDNYVIVHLNLGMTNHADGEGGLDSIMDIVVNPGTPQEYNINEVLFDNVDSNNIVTPYYTSGGYLTEATIQINKVYLRDDSTLVVRILRHTDNTGNTPHAPINDSVPIEPYEHESYLNAVYENGDPHTSHIGVKTEGSGVCRDGEVVAPGKVYAEYTTTSNRIGHCVSGTPPDCSGNDLDPIATCSNNPDGIAYTWDYFEGFNSICDEEEDKCTIGTLDLTHTCDMNRCGAECEEDSDCNCPVDGCVGNDYYDYPDYGTCESNCTCNVSNKCNGPCEPTIYHNDERCYACEDNDGDGYYAYDSNDCPVGNDCDDTNANINPGVTEDCDDGIDNDCDGLTDGNDPDCGEEQQPKEQTTTTTTKTVKKIGSGPSKGNSDYHIICGDHFCVMPQEMEEGIYYCPLDCSSILW